MNYVNLRIVDVTHITGTVLGRNNLPELRALRLRVKAQRKQLRALQRSYDALQWRVQLDLKGSND